jgi:FkbM family methyltransferase
VRGQEVLVRTSTPDLAVAISTLGDEYNSLALAYPKDRKGLIIDAGGYIGTAAVAFSVMYPDATIVCIEPSTENFALLKENTRHHANIHAVNAALVADRATEQIKLRNRGTGNWGFTIVEKPGDSTAEEMETVKAVTIDSVLAEHDHQDVMIFKMDIEGAEYELFRRSAWLDRTNILVVELHERIVAGCEEAFMTANGSRFVYQDNGEKYFSIGRRYFGD